VALREEIARLTEEDWGEPCGPLRYENAGWVAAGEAL
jgi:hypothetical protein